MQRRAFCKTGALALGGLTLAGTRSAWAGKDALSDAKVRALRAHLTGQLLLPGDAGYDAVRKPWNGAFDKHPALIARCTTAADVARSVEFARAQALLLALRGGGHSLAGYSTSDGGMLIDLSLMRQVRVDRAARSVRVQAGALLGDLDRESLAAGLITSTGTVSHTGVAGFALGGGFGRLARKFGLACDNLVGADLVTAEGRAIRATANENADLFWALRGGGGNFGAVTAFEFRAHAAPRTIGGAVVFAFEKPRDLLRAYADFSAAASDEFFAMADIVPTPEGQRVMAVEVCHCGDDATVERELAALRKIGTVVNDTVQAAPYATLQSGIDSHYPTGRGYYLKSGFVRDIKPALIDAVVDHLQAAPAPFCIASFLQLGGAISRVDPKATAYWHREAGHQVLLAGVWDEPGNAATRREWVRRGWTALEPHTEGFYVNLLAPDEAGPRIRNTYGANYPRLAAVKRRYDPANLFRLNANIAPAPA
jgi:FAD/FMN-containing dehydrogenase